MSRVRIAGLVASLLVLTLVGCAAPQQPWLAYTVEDAAARRKPLVIELYADWCGPCKRFEAEILPDPRVQEALTRVIFVRYDVDRPSGADAARRCGSSAVPTFVGIDRHGVVRLFKEGSEATAEEFLAFLAQAEQVLGAQWSPAAP